jgi:D-serine deaminase-like pyridoxal phosphate-dependent protein
VRSDDDALALARRVASRPLRLAGVAAFEGIIDGGSLEATLALVDALLDRVAALSQALRRESLLTAATPIATVGGSA